MEAVYLDYAASTPLREEVLESMMPFLTGHPGNPSSIHSHGRRMRAAIEKARKTVAELLGASPAEIVFTGGGTEADNLALVCAARQAGPSAPLISSPIEHHAVTHTLEWCSKNLGNPVVWLAPRPDGTLDPDELQNRLQSLKPAADGRPTAVVSLMHCNNEIGVINPIEQIAALCRNYGAFFHSDTVQSLGMLPTPVAEWGIDSVAGSAHKFYGPQGVGFLYRNHRLAVQPLILGGGQERNQRAGTENTAGIVGLAHALELAMNERGDTHRRLNELKTWFIDQLTRLIPGVEFNGTTDPRLSAPHVLNVAFPSDDVESLLLFNFDLRGISVSGGSACTSGSVVPSHVLQNLGADPARMANSVRFSFGKYTDRQQLERVLCLLPEILAVDSLLDLSTSIPRNR
jgi:cysteine desulfurase